MFKKQKQILMESSFEDKKIRGEGIDKIWFLFPEGQEITPIAFRSIKNDFLSGRQVEQENFIDVTEEPKNLRQWNVWFERQKGKNPGLYVRVFVWHKQDKKFMPISEVDDLKGKKFSLFGYEHQVLKKSNKEFNKTV